MSSALRVLHLGSPTGLYGAERWILALIRNLDGADIQSTVGVIDDVASPGPIPLLENAAQLGAGTHAVEAVGRLNWGAVRKLRRYILRDRIDILHTHFYKTDLIGLIAARGTGCRTVTTPHGWSTRAGLALRTYEAIDRQAFRWFDAVVPLSDDIYRGLQKSGIANLHFIPNGVDFEEVDAVRTLAAEARAWRTNEEYVVGYIGQLIPRKGLDTLLRAFASWRQAHPGRTRLVLVGEGDARTALEGLALELGIAEQTTFLGYRTDRLQLLKGFSVFVLPSQLEGVPRCLMEAMAAKVPVVASRIAGNLELLASDTNGLSFPVDDHLALRDALQHASSDVHTMDRVRRARGLVESEYSARSMALRYSALYQALSRHRAVKPNAA